MKKFLLTKSVGLYLNLLSYVAPAKAFKIAYKFFSHPRDGRLSKENLSAFLQSAEHETLRLDEHDIQTYRWAPNQSAANEKVILLAHGWESNSWRWEKLLPHLLQVGFTLVALDAPAHGLSSGKEFNVPLYVSFIDLVAKKHQPQIIIGHSLGGIAAAYYQFRHPNHPLQKMVLLGAPSDFSVILKNYIKMLSLNRKLHQAFEDYTLKRFQIEIADFSGQKFVSGSQLKGLIAHDEQDTIVLYKEAQKLASGWKNATLISTSGLGHSLHDEELNQKIVAFLLEN
ncbi:alpha/beta hydrolase [Flavobacterium sp. CYK-4]|uniref:alpha/beta hydrolase n=1 Tax=Flavobacterium lotistagni TaxID=2709660 RepID=UPI00140CC86C|nr:alpha/beta fold hydrolase [Flavobacterium lotistagni]NHM06338.1 alpha/beta hydrolase [Flavobacterium lotistagni]